MKAFLLSLIILTIVSCESTSKKANVTDFLNEEAQTIIRIKNLENLTSNIGNNHFLEQLNKTKTYNSLKETFEIFNKVDKKQNLYINLFSSEEFSFATKYASDLLKFIDSSKVKRDSISIDAVLAERITFNNKKLFITLKDSVIIGANTKNRLTEIYNQSKNASLLKLLKTTNDNAEISIINNQSNEEKSQIFIDSLLNKIQFTSHLAFDVDLSQENIVLNGITKATDTTKSLINTFRNTTPQDNELALITPNNSDGFLSITFNDFNNFRENLNTFNKKPTLEIETTLFDNITEVGIIYNDTNAIVLNSIDTESTKSALLENNTVKENYRSIPIYNFNDKELIKTHLYPFVNESSSLFCQLDQFFVFSNSMETLQNIIANYQNKTTLFFKDYYKQTTKQLSSQSSLLQVLNKNALERILNTSLDNKINLKLDDYRVSAFQFSYDYNFAHFNAVISKSKVVKEVNSISEKFNIKLDNAILNEPQFVKNDINNKNEIIVQDIKNVLYLISNNGKILWKKDLKETILGEVSQIDILKNGKLQYAFATEKAVYVIDRNGNDVKPFPVQLKDKISQPLSVFDYDKKKNYRFLVTQGKELLMLDSKGKTVNGFKAKKTKTITSQPQHFRIGTKDYIVFQSKNKLNILDRTGKVRVKVSENIDFNDHDIFLKGNEFASYLNDGRLVQVNQKGKVSYINVASKDVTKFDAINKTFTYLIENKLTIKNKTIELDFGNYTKPQLFYSNNKVFISVTDLQTQKIHVYDSSAKLLENFPVFGTSSIDLKNTNSLELITKGDANSIILYTYN